MTFNRVRFIFRIYRGILRIIPSLRIVALPNILVSKFTHHYIHIYTTNAIWVCVCVCLYTQDARRNRAENFVMHFLGDGDAVVLKVFWQRSSKRIFVALNWVRKVSGPCVGKFAHKSSGAALVKCAWVCVASISVQCASHLDLPPSRRRHAIWSSSHIVCANRFRLSRVTIVSSATRVSVATRLYERQMEVIPASNNPKRVKWVCVYSLYMAWAAMARSKFWPPSSGGGCITIDGVPRATSIKTRERGDVVRHCVAWRKWLAVLQLR